VAANNITLRGLDFGKNTPADGKAIEVLGNNFTFEACRLTADAPLYINDENYNNNGTPDNFSDDVSSIQSYTITNCDFAVGDVYIANGAGWTGANPASISGRNITGCTFRNFAIISFAGLTPGDAAGWSPATMRPPALQPNGAQLRPCVDQSPPRSHAWLP